MKRICITVLAFAIFGVFSCVLPAKLQVNQQGATKQKITQTPQENELEELIANKQWQQALALVDGKLNQVRKQGEQAEIPHLLYLRGVCLYNLGRLDEAKTTLEEVALNYPGNPFEQQAFALLEQVEKARTAKRIKEPTQSMQRFYAMCDEYTNATPEHKQQLLTNIEDFIVNSLSYDELLLLAQNPPQQKAIATPLLVAAARFAYHSGNRALARKFIDELSKLCQSNCKWRADVEQISKEIFSSAQANMLAVGVILPLSGRFKAVGERVLSALKLGFEGLQSADETSQNLVSTKIELFTCDDEANPAKAQSCVDTLVLEHKVSVILGPVLSKTAYRAALRAQWFGVPIITFSMREGLPQLGAFVFRVALTPRLEAEALARYAVKVLGLRKFAIIYPSDYYGIAMMNYFWDAAKKAASELEPPERIEITGCETYPNGITDFTFYVKRLTGRLYPNLRYEFVKFKKEERDKYTDPYRWRKAVEKFLKELPPIVDFDAIFIPDTARNVSMIVPTLAYEGLDMHTTKKWKLNRLRKRAAKQKRAIRLVWLLGPSTWHSNKLFERTGKFLEESVFCDAFYKEREDEKTKRFVDEYQKRFSTEPTTLEAFAFDIAGLLKEILTASDAPGSRVELRDKLLAIKKYEGVSGAFAFDKNGDFMPELFMLSYYDEKVVPADQIKPEKRRDIVYPPAQTDKSSGGADNGR